MKFSLRFNNDLPVRDYVRYAQAAEAAGFDQFWVSNDLFLRSAPVILSAVAIATERIEIGSCILNPFTLHPSEIAMFAATLDELSGGRFNLGISSGAEDFMRWLGLEFRYPRTRVLETVRAINKLTANQNAASDGVALKWTDEAWLRFRSERRVPIYLGAMSPKMLEAIGEVADGGLPLLFPPEHYANILPQVQRRAGAQRTDAERYRSGRLHLVLALGRSESGRRSHARRQDRLLRPRHEPPVAGAARTVSSRFRAHPPSLAH